MVTGLHLQCKSGNSIKGPARHSAASEMGLDFSCWLHPPVPPSHLLDLVVLLLSNVRSEIKQREADYTGEALSCAFCVTVWAGLRTGLLEMHGGVSWGGQKPATLRSDSIGNRFHPGWGSNRIQTPTNKASNRVTSTEDLYFSVFEIAAFKASLLLTTGQKVWAALVEQWDKNVWHHCNFQILQILKYHISISAWIIGDFSEAQEIQPPCSPWEQHHSTILPTELFFFSGFSPFCNRQSPIITLPRLPNPVPR